MAGVTPVTVGISKAPYPPRPSAGWLLVAQQNNRLIIPSLLVCALVLGCSDRLTGPEVAQVVDALESSHPTTVRERQRQLYWDLILGMLGGHKSPLLRAASKVVVRRAGSSVAYRAVVQEFVRVPESLTCLGTTWGAVLWNDDREHAWLFFRGADFSRGIESQVHWRLDCENEVTGPEPFLHVSEGDTNWVATDGEGDISQGEVIGECPFLTPEAPTWLREERGMTCELTRHKVRFRAHLRRAGQSLKVVPDSSAPTEIELRSSEVIGIRITIECDGTERTKVSCPRKRSS